MARPLEDNPPARRSSGGGGGRSFGGGGRGQGGGGGGFVAVGEAEVIRTSVAVAMMMAIAVTNPFKGH